MVDAMSRAACDAHCVSHAADPAAALLKQQFNQLLVEDDVADYRGHLNLAQGQECGVLLDRVTNQLCTLSLRRNIQSVLNRCVPACDAALKQLFVLCDCVLPRPVL